MIESSRVFPRPFTHGGDKAFTGGLMRRDIDLMEGNLTLIDYIIILLLLSCNYMM